MTELQQTIAMVFGAALATAGVALLFLREEGRSKTSVRLFGQHIELSTPALAVLLCGCAIFVLPFFLPVVRSTSITAIKPGEKPATSITRPSTSGPTIHTSFDGLIATVTRFDKSGEIVTVELLMKNTAPHTISSFCAETDSATLINGETGRGWRPVQHGGEIACWRRKQFPPDASYMVWMKFRTDGPAPRSYSLAFPNLLPRPVENLVIAAN